MPLVIIIYSSSSSPEGSPETSVRSVKENWDNSQSPNEHHIPIKHHIDHLPSIRQASIWEMDPEVGWGHLHLHLSIPPPQCECHQRYESYYDLTLALNITIIQPYAMPSHINLHSIQGKMVVWGFVKSPNLLLVGGVTDGFGNNLSWVPLAIKHHHQQYRL